MSARTARCVVDSGSPLGPYNRENLELLRAAARAGVPVLSLRSEPPEGVTGVQCFSTVRELTGRAAALAAPES